MLEFLVHKCIKDADEIERPEVRKRYGFFSSIVGIICNVILFASKLAIGLIAGSISIVSDGVNNLSDCATCIVTMFGYKMAAKPADRDHPFGHGRMEYLTSLVIAAAVVAVGFELLRSSVEKVMHPERVTFSFLALLVLVLSMLVKIGMGVMNRKLGTKLSSSIMLATSKDSFSDVFATLATTIALVMSAFSDLPMDGIMGIVVSVMIMLSGFGIVKDTVDQLLGQPADEELVAKIRELVLESYPLNYMTLNTGVYYLNDTDTPAEEVISHANIARRRAKETSTCVFEYNAELSSTEQKRAETIHSFQNALAKKEFQIYFQPKISGKTQEIASAEVLVRWLREDGTLWFPDSFLPILEETGEIESLDYYVYNAAFQWLADRRENGLPLLPLSLNVSPIHFRKIDTFTQRITQLLDHYQIPSKYLVFEITETTYIHNIDAVNQMIRFFHDRNIRISMDDFGSGYSSLNSLKDILFDEVKIDKHFLSAGLSEKGKIVLEEMFHLLKRTDKWIVCEGVETKEMVDFLIAEGCDELQGFYYYKPMEQKKFEELIA